MNPSAEGPPRHPLSAYAQRHLDQLARQALRTRGFPDANALIHERLACLGKPLPATGSVSGACRFVTTSDGVAALNLPRPDDWQLLPALFAVAGSGTFTTAIKTWHEARSQARRLSTAMLLERARLLGLAVADAFGEALPESITEVESTRVPQCSAADAQHAGQPPVVVDLSSLWAGPLCGRLLAQAGATVIKVESVARPDGARFGNAQFFRLQNQHKDGVVVDLGTSSGREHLLALIGRADIVIEASRPRALAQLGVHAADLIALRHDLTWLSITGFGRDAPHANWAAFGDDAAVAGGLAAEMYRAVGRRTFGGDAIADPLTGITAAALAWDSWQRGGSRLISVPLAATVRAAIDDTTARVGDESWYEGLQRWWSSVQTPPRWRPRPPEARAPLLGAHNVAWLQAHNGRERPTPASTTV